MIDRHSLDPIPALTSERLGVAVSSALLASVLTPLLMPFLEQNVFLLFLFAVLGSALYGGLLTGLVAALVSAIGISASVFRPMGSLVVASPLDVARLAAFGLFSVVICVLAQALLAARRRAEQRARDAAIGEESFRELFNSTADAIYVTGPKGRLLNINQAACELHGHPRSEILGRSWDTLLDATLSDPETLREHIEGAFSGVPQSFEAWVRAATPRSCTIAWPTTPRCSRTWARSSTRSSSRPPSPGSSSPSAANRSSSRRSSRSMTRSSVWARSCAASSTSASSSSSRRIPLSAWRSSTRDRSSRSS